MGFYNSDLMGIWYEWDVPSGFLKIACEHGRGNCGFFPIEHVVGFHSYDQVPEGNWG